MAQQHPAEQILAGIDGRTGHFLLESGLHSDLWFSLDALFVEPAIIAPQVDALARLLRPYQPTAACGPLLGGAFLAQALATILGIRFYYCQQATANPRSHLFGARYRLPNGLRSVAAGERFALVDDVISAGSSVRAAADEIASTGASLLVVGTLLLLGTKAAEHFSSRRTPLVSVASRSFDTWPPAECPLCRAGANLENPARL